MQFDAFLDRLEGVRRAGTGYVAVCPSHEDHNPSLGVTASSEGILLNCHAGCSTQDVLTALGLEWGDLFFNRVNHSEPESIYEYVDENGDLLFEAIRFPGKKFRQRHHDSETGEEVWNLDGVRRVLYRLPEVIQGVRQEQTIFVCEGEKDVEAIRAAGKIATCNPMGAGKWKPEFAQYLSGARVAIVADRDEPGRAHAEAVKQSLQGIAKAVYVLQAKQGKDAYDHLVTHGLSLEELQPLKQRVRRGIITSRELADQGQEDLSLTEADIPGYQLVEAIPLVFRQGRMYAIGAYQGDGKSRFALQGTRKLATEGKRGAYWCVAPTERILTSDLRWIPAADIEVGQELIGFPEDLQPYQGTMSGATVLANKCIRRPCYRITTTRGNIVVSAEHSFVKSTEFKKGSYRREWVEAQNLSVGDRLSYFIDPWNEDDIAPDDRGYLAAAFDGEGSLNEALKFFQNKNPMLDKVLSLLDKYGLKYSILNQSTPRATCIRVSKHSSYRILGIARPARLLPKSRHLWEGRRIWGKQNHPAEVIGVEFVGERDVIAIGTSTGTLISEGFLSHNSLEMPERDLRNALLTHKGIPLSLLEEPWRLRMDAAMHQLYLDGLEEIASWNVDFICKSTVDAEEIAQTAFDREHEFVMVDHLHRIPARDRSHLEAQVKGLTNMALEQNLMLVALCQLRKHQRGKDMVVYPIPTLNEFRETSQIADDASMALAIWRQRDDSGMRYTGSTQVIVLKNRHTTGPNDATGTFFFPAFDSAHQMLVAQPQAVTV